MVDRRLLGTWKSDRRRTFQNFKPRRACAPQVLRRLKAIFGKLFIRYGPKRYYTDLDGIRDSGAYEIVARDSKSVVIRHHDTLSGEDRLQHIHFDGEFYWIAVAIVNGTLREFFRRIPDEADAREVELKTACSCAPP
jgi:hypothetical protein